MNLMDVDYTTKIPNNVNLADDRQVGHSDLFKSPFLNERHVPQAIQISGPTIADLLEKSTIDFEDDFQMTRKYPLNEIHRPFFECFRQKRMVGVSARRSGHLPGLVPIDLIFIDKHPHHFGDSQ